MENEDISTNNCLVSSEDTEEGHQTDVAFESPRTRSRSRFAVSRLIKACSSVSGDAIENLISAFQHETEIREILHEWHLNTIKSRACSLAVWAVDQGNRKVYEMERALMAENSWIGRSIVWDGFSQHPLTGITNSKCFWACSAAKELGENRIPILCEQLQVRQCRR